MRSMSDCTCALGHADHDDDCYCTTAIMDCEVHADSDIGRIEWNTS